MGTWGTRLYDDDVALDVKETYQMKLEEGKNKEQALNEILTEFDWAMDDEIDSEIFWIALADTLLTSNNLSYWIRNKALDEIKKGKSLAIWKEQATKQEYEARNREIQKIKENLQNTLYLKNNPNYKGKWEIGDVYAYRIEGKETREDEGRYLLFRIIDETEWIRGKVPITYIQITEKNKLPTEKNELEKLEYIIMRNFENVRYGYRTVIESTSKRTIPEKLIYIGNYQNIQPPQKEYIQELPVEMELCLWKRVNEDFLERLKFYGTDLHPIYHEGNIENINDSKLRFLIRLEYYKQQLGITHPKEAIVKDNALLYISFIDSLMLPGLVRNPTGMRVENMREEAYKRIDELKEVIANQNETEEKKKQRCDILDDLKKRIAKHNDDIIKIGKGYISLK